MVLILNFIPILIFILKPNLREPQPVTISFLIEKVKRVNDKLIIDVKYAGGCADHDFDIVWDGIVNLSSPQKVNLLLKHNSNGDKCEALLSNSIQVDLKSYFDNLIEINNTEFVISNASSIQEISSLTGVEEK